MYERKRKRYTREEVERLFYQLDSKGGVLASLLMDISDDLKAIRDEIKIIRQQNQGIWN